MSGQIPRPVGSTVLVATLLLFGVGVGVPTNTARADDCLTAPNSPAPQDAVGASRATLSNSGMKFNRLFAHSGDRDH
jgi:hypothetical protein